jgi:hypothetical protein
MAAAPKFLIDTNVAGSVADGLRRRRIDVVRIEDVGLAESPDPDLLEYAFQEHRIFITHDRLIWEHHAQRLQDGKHHWGIFICAHHLRGTDHAGGIIRQVVKYHDFVVGGAASIEHDFADRIIDVE